MMSTSVTKSSRLVATLLLLALPACSDDSQPGRDATALEAGAADARATDQATQDTTAADQRAADAGAGDATAPDSTAADSAAAPDGDAAGGCDPEHLPSCIESLIAQLESEPVTNPPSSLTLYEYAGQCVYYRPPVCCDQYSEVYDAKCQVICAPDGGIMGQGDGKCPDFFTNAVEIKLVWQDSRPYP